MTEAYICDYIRTPIGRFAGGLSSVRTDDLGAIALRCCQLSLLGLAIGGLGDEDGADRQAD